ncbi:DUF2125 domain-containing protein [Asticcacaulis sp. EMRT-3]|uniref:DUF2125 domain-containing protein n=1 Tax=Asticcacaulis sp. EMRT-3 TaxID=3040349 RepID=UPI0024AFF6D0|nr:DUF2125 domain-containing protein [Asticcacaulis sp. EMRT-3]MDI7775459.1 DUF2125 domain-containing protein [Asticcacaulis sp. EMRT-3]
MSETKKKHHRIGIFAPFILVVLLFSGWSAYWFSTAHRLEAEFAKQRDGLIHAGYKVSYAPFRIRGFPYRMAADFKNLQVIAPSGRGFAAPSLEAQADAWALDKWVMVASSGLTIYRGHPGGVDLGSLTVSGSVLRASVSHIGQPIYHVALQGLGLKLVPSDPGHPFAFATADNFEAYLRPDATISDAADMLVRVTGAKGVPQSLVGGLSGDKPLSLQLEATVEKLSGFKGRTFDDSLKAWSAAGGQISGLKSQVQAGDLSLFSHADGLSLQADGHVSGHVDIEMSGTFKPMEVLGALRIISPENMTLAKPLLDMTLATQSTQKFGIDFRDGGAYIGLLRVSDAPVFP